MTKIIFATTNKGKLREFQEILPEGKYSFFTMEDIGFTEEIEEDGTTFLENAAIKAKAVARFAAGSETFREAIVLADDSGLCADALGGYPGVLSARYAGVHGNDAANNAKLLRELSHLASTQPFTARFMCAMCVAEGGRRIAEFVGSVEGTITLSPRGEHGFGYDPLFVPQGGSLTMAELPAERKNAISHRSDALRRFREWAEQ